MDTPTNDIELDPLTYNMVYPYMDDFINNPMRRSLADTCFWCPLYSLQFWFDYYTSDNYLSNLMDKHTVKSSMRDSRRKKKKEIQKTVRSYRYNFQKFNDKSYPSCFEKTEDGVDFIRGSVNCKTNRNIQQKV
jgi:signal recognition particle subunit SEC65